VVSSAAQRARHVLGVPLWPVRIRPTELLLVNSVRGCGTLQRLQQDVGHFTVERFVMLLFFVLGAERQYWL
jgi:hypothetical protein